MKRIDKKYLVLADQALYSGFGFVSTIWVARGLPPESFGVFSGWMLGLYLLVGAVGAWSMQPFQIRYGQVEHSGAYVAFVCTWQGLMLAAVTVVAALVAGLTHYTNAGVLLLFGLGFVSYDFVRKLLLVMDRARYALALNILTGALQSGMLMLLSLKGKFDLFSVSAGFSIAYGIAALWGLALLGPFSWDSAANKTHIAYHIREGRWFFMTAISQWWAGNLYVVASGLLLGPVALGALRLSQSLFGVLNVLLQTFENYILPQTAQKMRTAPGAGITYLKQIIQKAGWLFLSVLFLVFILATPLLKLAGGSQYAPYAYVLQGLSILYVFIFAGQPLRCLIRSLELNRAFFQGYLLTLGFALAFSHLLLSTMGLYGVVLGLILSQIILILYWSKVLYSTNKSVWKSFISY